MKIFTLILFGFILLVSCNRVKKEGKDLVDKSKRKAKDTWQEVVDKTSQTLTPQTEISFESAFGNVDSLNVTDIKGLRIDYIISFYAGFLKYEADKDTIINYFSTLKTRLPDISDDTAQVTTLDEIKKTLKKRKEDDPSFYRKLDFFREFENLDSITVYKCNKYPLSHHIIVDENSRTIFHHFENYWD